MVSLLGIYNKGRKISGGSSRQGRSSVSFWQLLFGLVAILFAPGAIGLGLGLAGGFGILIGVILLVIIFLAGAFIGDWLEGMQEK